MQYKGAVNILKSKYMFNKKVIISIICIFSFLLIVPIGLYVINFFSIGISSNPVNWGVFGDYIGGIINPIIGIASLIVLGYLTIIMGKQSTEESKKLFLLQQKMDAFNILVKNIDDFELLPEKYGIVKLKSDELLRLSLEQQGYEHFKLINEIYDVDFSMTKIYYSIKNFGTKYQHLFKYNFSSEEYLTLLEKAVYLKECFAPKKIQKMVVKEADFENHIAFAHILYNIINKLKSEIETKY